MRCWVFSSVVSEYTYRSWRTLPWANSMSSQIAFSSPSKTSTMPLLAVQNHQHQSWISLNFSHRQTDRQTTVYSINTYTSVYPSNEHQLALLRYDSGLFIDAIHICDDRRHHIFMRKSNTDDLYSQNTLYACIGSGENRGSKLANRSAAFSTNQRSPSSWSLIGWERSIPIG